MGKRETLLCTICGVKRKRGTETEADKSDLEALRGDESARRIARLVKNVNGVDCFVIFGNSGFAAYSNLTDSWLTNKVATLAFLLREIGNMMAAEVGKGEAETITVCTKNGSGIVVYTKPCRMGNIAVVLDKHTKIGVLLYTLKHSHSKVE